MLKVVPNYYTAFRCVGGECRHNCCIGWEIGIDEESLSRYRALPKPWQERFDKHVSHGDEPHFIVDENERCPFLNHQNLCDIQLAFGETQLCVICREHPRFHNELPERTESGVGLCCEAAARLILGEREPLTLCYSGTEEQPDAIVDLRDRLLAVLRDRSCSVNERCVRMLAECNTTPPPYTMAEWCNVLLSLERLDPAWTDTVKLLKQSADTAEFERYMADRQTEYEQLVAYFVYRHVAGAATKEDAAVRARFAVLSYQVLSAIGAVLFTKTGHFTFEEHCELARAFSAEIEYSDENLDILWDTLGGID